MRKTIVFLAVAALGLASCQSTSIDSTIQQNLPRTCALIDTAHAAFVAASVAGTISRKTVKREAAAYASTRAVCADPANVTTADALVLAAQAYATISLAMKEGKKRK